MDCFERAGVKHGRLVCACKARVLFKDPRARAEHFMVCPEVDAAVAAAVARISAVELQELAEALNAGHQD